MKQSVTVETKSELENAKDQKVPEIIVTGELANKLKKSKNIALLSGAALATLTAALAAAAFTAPVTGGLSFLAAAPVAALTGAEIAAIIAVSAIGISLVLAIYKEYDEISYEDGKLKLKRKRD